MRKDLFPGEQVIVSTRPQPRKLAGAMVAFILSPAIAAYCSAWVIRGEAGRAFPALSGRWTPWLVMGCVLAAASVWLGFCLPRLLRWHSTRYTLTSRRLVARSGMWKRRDQQAHLASVRNLTVHESVLQRLFRSGNISLEIGYQGVVTFPDVPEVARFRDFILDAIGDLPDEHDAQPGGTTDYPAGALPWDKREGGPDER
ncbi:PH domain-containing protein [Arthrobacter sp. ZGTC412]|uniref:PH domain-containing protein n=1 Tax=Arthrobacter sp. ZGTC412 TaxID=2058900 RepID=UPI000CE2C1A7|nr:PH domain-containing protein [Arthrobacter sp. ZGTC412]